ncbi:uncharacterized protein LOC125711416 [Brienomyrus brachyistius]|uniref:uncharacterized protein LOC125711416 n=1 Tax=Brienomyrus brachyistius TaxID=42636 RepID=UPI0020B3B4B1|nr:uncharacterized protein LOC125711416 [Brienomyrus brachyistius]
MGRILYIMLTLCPRLLLQRTDQSADLWMSAMPFVSLTEAQWDHSSPFCFSSGRLLRTMNPKGIHYGFLRKYGGFMFKQWKEKYLVLNAQGNLLVCRDAESPPDQVLSLSKDCLLIAEGREILDLPRLPRGGRRECCLALILTQDKFLLLLAENANDCSQWLNMLRKVRQGVTSNGPSWKRQPSFTTSIMDGDPVSSQFREGETPAALFRAKDNTSYYQSLRRGKGTISPRAVQSGPLAPPPRSPDCLRHGNSIDARAVRAVCLLMGGAAASSMLGCLSSLPPPSHNVRSADSNPSSELSGLGTAGEHHAANSPNIQSFDFEGDSDFDTFDCGGFAF